MNKQVFIKLIIMTTAKYILSRVLKTVDNKLFYQEYNKLNEPLYVCNNCDYLFTSKLVYTYEGSFCPCCKKNNINIFTVQEINLENTATIKNKLYNNIYNEAFYAK